MGLWNFMIKGMTITLLSKVQIGTDGFNQPIYEYGSGEDIENVLVGEPTADERTDELNLSGKHIAYVLGIPKGDTHNWEDQIVEFFGKRWMTIGFPIEGIEENIPTQWHKKVKVERYE